MPRSCGLQEVLVDRAALGDLNERRNTCDEDGWRDVSLAASVPCQIRLLALSDPGGYRCDRVSLGADQGIGEE
jgi:hypothetical protein